MNSDQARKGIIVYCGGRPGRIIRRQGALAVKVLTERHRTFQDFTTGKVTTTTGPSEETWGISRCSISPPAPDPAEIPQE